MTDGSSDPISERLRRLSVELRTLEVELKSGKPPETLLLQDFRHVLDNARLTAWTVSELLNARERQQDPAKVISFVVAERLRRANQMLKDLCADIEQEGVTWQTHGIQSLFDTVKQLQVQLIKLIDEHRTRFEKVHEAGR
ncbi:MAG TPA: hypothetical protein VJW20_19255 [Candidatus Angelobacter sp.]|nr:hypothetical protein [Candidatus Angelobacter sp.]